MTVQAIPTLHNGTRFRSRLEARWAVFFDAMGVEWLYEFEGFQLPSCWYLPDFFLPKLDTWVELKPTDPTQEERAKCGELATATGKRVVLLYGKPGWWLSGLYGEDVTGGGEAFWPEDRADSPFMPCVCPTCGRFGLEWEGSGDRVCAERACRAMRVDESLITKAAGLALRKQFTYGKSA